MSNHVSYVTLSAKSSLILGENKPGFHREGHIFILTNKYMTLKL